MPRTRGIVSEEKIEHLSSNIRKRRRWLRMTQTELGKEIGVTQQRIAMFEKGDAIPDIFQMQSIASALNATIEMLLNLTAEKIMKNENIDLDRKRLLQDHNLKSIRRDLKANEMVTVYRWNSEDVKGDYFILSGLIRLGLVEEILSGEHISSVIENVWSEPMAYCPSGESEIKYFRWGVDEDTYGTEPLVIGRRFSGVEENYVEISEEFRLFHNLYHDKETDKYIKIDDAGNKNEVVTVKPNEVQIRLKEIRQYLAIKEMYLSMLFEFNEYSEYSLQELGLSEIEREFKRDGLMYWRHDYCGETGTYRRGFQSDSRLRGRRLISPLPKSKSGFGDFAEEPKYVEFIVDVDDNGNEVYHTCNPYKLGEYPGENSDAAWKLTLVHFRKQVLDKYYNEPSKYSVEDSMIRCGMWSMKIDNHTPNKVCVFLDELGIHLPYEEQLYWLAYNIPPEGGVSETFGRRNFGGEWASSDQPDLLFKQSYDELQRVCDERLGWQILELPGPGDEDRLRSLRVPTVNEESHLKNLILDLAVLLVELLNQKRLKGLIPAGKRNQAKGEINRLEYVLSARQVTEVAKHISFLKSLRDLRNTYSKAHIENLDDDRYKSAAAHFDLENLNYQEGGAKMLEEAVDFLDFLISVVRSGKLSDKSDEDC